MVPDPRRSCRFIADVLVLIIYFAPLANYPYPNPNPNPNPIQPHHVEHLHLVGLVIEAAGHRRRVHGHHIDACRPQGWNEGQGYKTQSLGPQGNGCVRRVTVRPSGEGYRGIMNTS